MMTTQMAKNAWRLETPGVEGWTRTARPGRPEQVLHGVGRLPRHRVARRSSSGSTAAYRDRIPHVETREDGAEFLITEGNRPQMVKPPNGHRRCRSSSPSSGPSTTATRSSRMEDEDLLRVGAGRSRRATPRRPGRRRRRRRDRSSPPTGLLCWATPDPVFAMAMCRAWNRWAVDQFGAHMLGDEPKILPMALIAAGDQEGAMREIEWAAEHGFRGRVPRQLADLRSHRAGQAAVQRPVVRADVVAARGDRPRHHLPRVDRQGPPRRWAAGAGPSSTTSATRWRPRSSRSCSSSPSGVFERHPAPAGRPRRERHRLRAVAARDAWTTPTAPTTSGCARSSPSCRRSTSAATASPRSRRTTPAWRTWRSSTSSTTCCGPTTTRTTRACGRTRRRHRADDGPPHRRVAGQDPRAERRPRLRPRGARREVSRVSGSSPPRRRGSRWYRRRRRSR